jgi:hypothetical protein
MSDHGDHGHDDDHGHGHGAAAEPEVPAEPRPVLQGVGIALCVLGTVLLAIFVQS